MITVHHLENSRSQRVLWLLEELGLPYQIKRYARDPQTLLAPSALRAVHPLGKSPVICDGDETIAESGAIIEFLLQRYGDAGLKPASGSKECLRYTYWLHYAEGSAMTPLLLSLVFRRLPQGPMPFWVRPIVRKLSTQVIERYVAPQIAQHLDFIETELAAGTWFCGEHFSAADIQMSFPIEAALGAGWVGDLHPRLRAFVERIRERQAYRRAMERGGSFDL